MRVFCEYERIVVEKQLAHPKLRTRRYVPRMTRSTSMRPSQITRIGVIWRNTFQRRIVSRNFAAHGMSMDVMWLGRTLMNIGASNQAKRTTRRSLFMGPSDGTAHLGRKGCRGYTHRQGAMKFAIDIRSLCTMLGFWEANLGSRPSIWRKSPSLSFYAYVHV